MKLPTIKSPRWWKPWHRYYVLGAALLGFNVYGGYTATLWWSAALSWFAAGMTLGLLVANSYIQRAISIMKDQQELIEAINNIKTEEIARHMAAEMHANMTGERPRPETRH